MWVSLIRTVLLYFLLLLAVRIMGKRQISQLQTSELVVTLFISELAVMPIQEANRPLWEGVLPIVVLVLCERGVSFWMLKSGKFRQVVCGKPIVVIENGRILQDQMKSLRMTTEDLYEQLRQNDVFYLSEVAFAIIETNGMMSVMKTAAHDYVTPEEMGLSPKDLGLEVVVISDGEISKNSLKLCKKDKAWLQDILAKERLSLPQVFLMTARADGAYQIIGKTGK